jgi:hypothetical protein
MIIKQKKERPVYYEIVIKIIKKLKAAIMDVILCGGE